MEKQLRFTCASQSFLLPMRLLLMVKIAWCGWRNRQFLLLPGLYRVRVLLLLSRLGELVWRVLVRILTQQGSARDVNVQNTCRRLPTRHPSSPNLLRLWKMNNDITSIQVWTAQLMNQAFTRGDIVAKYWIIVKVRKHKSATCSKRSSAVQYSRQERQTTLHGYCCSLCIGVHVRNSTKRCSQPIDLLATQSFQEGSSNGNLSTSALYSIVKNKGAPAFLVSVSLQRYNA